MMPKNRATSLLFMFVLLFVISFVFGQTRKSVIGQEVEIDALLEGGTAVTADEPAATTLMLPLQPDVLTLYQTLTADVPTLDPPKAEDADSVDYIENLFVNLTNFDPLLNEVIPEAATGWQIRADGLVYTFTLRTDIPWVKHDQMTGLTTQVVDGNNNPRFVTADDFVYGIKRVCDPNLATYQNSVIGALIVGCSDVLDYPDPANIPPALFDAIGVTAPFSDTLVIEMTEPAGNFLTMTPMWKLAAVPEWTITTYGDLWTEPQNIVTNGRFVLREWVYTKGIVLWRNPLMPGDMQGTGNVEQIATQIVADNAESYNLWLTGKVATSPIPDVILDAHLTNFPGETDKIPDLAVFYVGFRMSKAPFDNVNLRRAFSAAIDRQQFVDQVRQGQGYPMRHLTPPGIFGAPPGDQVGVGYSLNFAQNELAQAGYPNCAGLPTVNIMGYSGQTTTDWLNFVKDQWVNNLGCDPAAIQIQQVSFEELLQATDLDTPDNQAPHMWTLGWGPDYADANNYVGDILHCMRDNRTKRTCNAIDTLIEQARAETDPATRIPLYAQIEDGFFGTAGEFPIAPLYSRSNSVARHDWLVRIPVLFGGEQWYDWVLNPAIQDVSPVLGPNNVPVTIDIYGFNFASGGWADLWNGANFQTIEGLTLIDNSHLRGIVPVGTPTGIYTLTVSNPDESSASLGNAYAVIDGATFNDLYALSTDLWLNPLTVHQGDPDPTLGLLLRRQGETLQRNVAVAFYQGDPAAGGSLIGSNTVPIAPNSVAPVSVTWPTPHAGLYDIYAVIDPADEVPEASETNNVISRTMKIYTPFADLQPPTVTAFSVDNGALTTDTPDVVLNATAVDNVGVSSIIYVDHVFRQGVNHWVVANHSGWLPYQDAHVDYAWTLQPETGIHFLQAWVADAAGNISLLPGRTYINYIPVSAHLAQSQVHIYRLPLTAGETVSMTLTATNLTDADLYLWNQDATLAAIRELGDADRQIVYTAPAGGDGIYQVEVEGLVSTDYQLVIEVDGAPLMQPASVLSPVGRAQPFLLPSEDPSDDVGLPDAPAVEYQVYLPVVLKN